MEKWVEFQNSRTGSYNRNYVSYDADKDTRLLGHGISALTPPTEEEIEKHREEATDITGNSYCFISEDPVFGTKRNICRYIDNADSYFGEIEILYTTPVRQENVYINSVNSRSTFVWPHRTSEELKL